jgi:hypothetical protein
MREFWIWSKLIYFRNLGWIGGTRRIHHSPYVYETTRYCTCSTQSLRQCYRTGVVASRPSWPWGRLRRLHHQRMYGGIIFVFGLWGYIIDLPLIVTALLIDRSWCIRNCVGFFLLFAPNPNSINYTLFDLVTRQVLFTRSVIWNPCDLVTCLQAVSMQYHQEGPEYISPSSEWTNYTLDLWSSNNTFGVSNSTFVVTLLGCDVWHHQSTPPV